MALQAASSSSGGSWQLPNLQELSLYDTDFCDPAVFSCMPNITHLRCAKHEWLEDVLPVLPQLPQLQKLELHVVLGDAPAEDYAALTANTQLRSLDLRGCWMASTAAQHMLAAGRVLPHLTKLCICTHELWADEEEPGKMFPKRVPEGQMETQMSLVLGPADVAQLVRCCPMLQELRMLMLTADVTVDDLAPLLQLTVLRCLGIGGDGCSDSVAEQLLPKLSGERHTDVALLVS
jgi:hypothetical protein